MSWKRLKKAFTPPKRKVNIVKAALAPVTGGLSLIGPTKPAEKVVGGASSAIRYTTAGTLAVFAPVLPAGTQRKVFGLTGAESKWFERTQKISRGVIAAIATGGAAKYAFAGSSASAAGSLSSSSSAAPVGTSPLNLFSTPAAASPFGSSSAAAAAAATPKVTAAAGGGILKGTVSGILKTAGELGATLGLAALLNRQPPPQDPGAGGELVDPGGPQLAAGRGLELGAGASAEDQGFIEAGASLPLMLAALGMFAAALYLMWKKGPVR